MRKEVGEDPLMIRGGDAPEEEGKYAPCPDYIVFNLVLFGLAGNGMAPSSGAFDAISASTSPPQSIPR